ncbi:MAG TPA: hypothetical protein VGN86_01340 [Pyrinomonadaceae bacterium]|nr:hypothetical protein [Pyrinomonadaceae bacterium]
MRNRSRAVASAILLSLVLSLNLLAVSAQSYQKRITTVWTATSAAGSTVHVVSDTAVNDYEAYTRGGRFYVKIPASDLPSARGSLLGRGFDDVQIQRYGNGIIISFHLLPGTSARVQQGGDRLDVIFTSAGKTSTPSASSIDESNRVRPRRLVDGAGPTPDSAAYERTGRRSNRNGSQYATRNPSPASNSKQPVAGSYESPKPSPSKEVAVASPRPSATPYASPSPAIAVASPVTTPSPNSVVGSSSPTSQYSPYQQPTVSSTPATGSKADESDWAGRLNYWKLWAQLNWIPILVGSLILVSLLVLAFFWRGLQRVKAVAVEASDPPDSSETALPENKAALENPVTERSSAAAAAAGSASSGFSESQPASTAPEDSKDKGADPDREVFEL